jgi:hypothetical protein
VDIDGPPESRSPSPVGSVDIHSTNPSVLSVVSLADELPPVVSGATRPGKMADWLKTSNARLAQLVSVAVKPLEWRGSRGPYLKGGVQAPRTERRKHAEIRESVAQHGLRPLDKFFKPRPTRTPLENVEVIELDGDEEEHSGGEISAATDPLGLKDVLYAATALRERTTDIWDDEAYEGGRPAVFSDGIDGLWGDGAEDDLLADAVRANALLASASATAAFHGTERLSFSSEDLARYRSAVGSVLDKDTDRTVQAGALRSRAHAVEVEEVLDEEDAAVRLRGSTPPHGYVEVELGDALLAEYTPFELDLPDLRPVTHGSEDDDDADAGCAGGDGEVDGQTKRAPGASDANGPLPDDWEFALLDEEGMNVRGVAEGEWEDLEDEAVQEGGVSAGSSNDVGEHAPPSSATGIAPYVPPPSRDIHSCAAPTRGQTDVVLKIIENILNPRRATIGKSAMAWPPAGQPLAATPGCGQRSALSTLSFRTAWACGPSSRAGQALATLLLWAMRSPSVPFRPLLLALVQIAQCTLFLIQLQHSKESGMRRRPQRATRQQGQQTERNRGDGPYHDWSTSPRNCKVVLDGAPTT